MVITNKIPSVNMESSSYDYSSSFGNVTFTAAPFSTPVGPVSAAVALPAPSIFLEKVLADMAKQMAPFPRPILTFVEDRVTWDASILQFETDDFWGFFSMGNDTITAQSLTASTVPLFNKHDIGLTEDAILGVLLQFLHLSENTFLPSEIAAFIHESAAMGSLEMLTSFPTLHSLSSDDLHAWNFFLPLVRTFYEGNMSYWASLQFSSPVSHLFYSWVTADLHPTIALGLAVFMFHATEMAWDLCFCHPSHRFQILWSGSTFIYIPATNGPFLITPLNWFFAVSLWKWLLLNQSLKFRVVYGMPISLVLVSERLDRHLTRK